MKEDEDMCMAVIEIIRLMALMHLLSFVFKSGNMWWQLVWVETISYQDKRPMLLLGNIFPYAISQGWTK